MTRKSKKPAVQKGVVLVVGDSFIDENWLMSRGDVYHSYNVGMAHYFSNLPGADSRIISFCGAAGIWRILNGPNKGADGTELLRHSHGLVAASAWNPRDDKLLRCMLCDRNQATHGLTPYCMSGVKAEYTMARCQFNGDAECRSIQKRLCNVIANSSETKNCTSSNRLIRLYEGFGSDQPRLKYRFDWRLELKEKYKNYAVINRIARDYPSTNVAIVVADHGYGVVNTQLVERLVRKFPGAQWYIRCKLESADWLDTLAKKACKIKLVFTDEQLLQHSYGVRRWRHGPIALGRQALEVLGKLLGLRTYVHGKPEPEGALQADRAVLLFEDDTAIGAARTGRKGASGARAKPSADAALLNISSPPGQKQFIQVGRSSVFFASLVYSDLLRGPDKVPFEAACEWALHNAHRWTKECTEAWRDAQPGKLSGNFDTAIYAGSRPWKLGKDFDAATRAGASARAKGKPERALGPGTYEDNWSKWNKSSENCGIVHERKSANGIGTEEMEAQIHLWRAQGTLEDYICPGGKKRSDINDLITRLHAYGKKEDPGHPFNCLFLAEPGWGKTHLAQCLAAHFKFPFLSFSIAQMASNEDLKHCLKEIVSTQNRTRSRLLVFIDEIDAQIQSHAAMGLLLDPMWGGSFVSEGNVYRIEPCVWAFASTKPVALLRKESKGRDFLSRINGPIIDLDFFGNHRDELHVAQVEEVRWAQMKTIVEQEVDSASLRTELVYQGVTRLNRLFGPISAIDRSVLEVFYHLIPIDGIRSIDIFASRFRDISRGRVTMRNVPVLAEYPELERHICKLEGWPEEDSGEMVKVIVDPPK